MLSTGTFERALDGKMRVLLPKSVRQSIPTGEQLFATPGTDGCLELHTNSSIRDLAESALGAGRRTTTAKSFARLFYSQAERLEFDKQGRVRIPARLASWAELKGQLAIVGAGSHWEIWDLGRWKVYFSDLQKEFDELHQSTFEASHERAESQQTIHSEKSRESIEHPWTGQVDCETNQTGRQNPKPK